MSFLTKIKALFATKKRKEDEESEVKPPWVVYPDHPPGDGFWRQAGEGYYAYGWLPYFESLSPDEKEAYLTRWPPTPEWRDAIDQAWL